MRIGFVPLDTAMKRVGNVASTRFRVRWVSEYIPDSIISDSLDELKLCDVVIFQSRMSASDVDMAKSLKEAGIKLMLDLTDPEWHELYLKGASPPPYIGDMIAEVDLVTLASENLRKLFLETFKAKTEIMKDRVDLKRHDIFKKHWDKTEGFKIVWHGSYGNINSVDELARIDLEKLGAEFDVELVMVYDRSSEFGIVRIPENISKYTVKEWNRDSINHNIIDCDVSINPRYDDWRNYKTNNKTVKAWALGVPCVERNFYEEIKKLFKSAELRNKLAEQNRKIVEEEYDVKISADEIVKLSESLIKKTKRKKKNKIAVITAIDGGKDYLKEVDSQFREKADFIAYTDEEYYSETWDVRNIRKFFATPCLNAKIYKVLIHQFTEEYEYSLWIDGSIVPKANISLMVDKYLKNADIAIFKHKARDCIYDEHAVTMELKRDRPELLMAAINKYKKTHPPKAGLYECGIILRRNSKKMEEFNNAWWSEITTFTECDQIPFMYLARKMNIKINDFGAGNMYVSKLFKYEEHVKPLKPVEETKGGNNTISLDKLRIGRDTTLIKKTTAGDYNVSKVGVLTKDDYIYVNREIAEGLLSGHPNDFELIKSN